MCQDRALDTLQRRARLDAELLHHRPAGRLVGGQRFWLPPAAVQGNHQLLVQPLAQRALGNQRLQLANNVGVMAEREIGFDPVLEDAGPQVLQPGDLHLRERLIAEIGQRGAAPQRQRLAEVRRRLAGRVRRQRLPPLPGQALEPAHIDMLVLDPQQVRARPGQHQLIPGGIPQRLAQPGDVHLQGVLRARGKMLPPQLVSQNIAGDGLVRPEHEHRQQRPLLRPADLDGPPVGVDPERPEKPVFDHCHTTPHATVKHGSGLACGAGDARPRGCVSLLCGGGARIRQQDRALRGVQVGPMTCRRSRRSLLRGGQRLASARS